MLAAGGKLSLSLRGWRRLRHRREIRATGVAGEGRAVDAQEAAADRVVVADPEAEDQVVEVDAQVAAGPVVVLEAAGQAVVVADVLVAAGPVVDGQAVVVDEVRGVIATATARPARPA